MSNFSQKDLQSQSSEGAAPATSPTAARGASQGPTVWRLKAGLEKKFHRGHPWVFSSDLDQSPKGHVAGAPVELRDARNQFLAHGYGHPNTLIAFRKLSQLPQLHAQDSASAQQLLRGHLLEAAELRRRSGVDRWSHRLLFGEADQLPGLIVDRYWIQDEKQSPQSARQVFVLQSSTAGADRLLPELQSVLEKLVSDGSLAKAFGGRGQTPMLTVWAQDSSSRAMEGLPRLERRVCGNTEGVDLHHAWIAVERADRQAPVHYEVDFLGGQKTGFFLDQRANLRLIAAPWFELLRTRATSTAGLRTLDLFSYVGQWSVQLAALAAERASIAEGAKNFTIELTLADASAAALEHAEKNVRRALEAASWRVAEVHALKMDVLDGLKDLPVAHYDVVICDPPAFVKKKKDLPTGRAAYFKVNREALKRVAPGGLFVTCSCSGLFEEAEFAQMLADAVRASGRKVHWIAKGGHGEDHPSISSFPQGVYLKGWMACVD
ncbi:MAG TPA: class I SAM-dependent methyltransferase [Pseudobdellovibrionaceae bacterium]|nr:class I SAM-dependent methyltransferase [Pseudobdellovibrionaceae bacterium]